MSEKPELHANERSEKLTSMMQGFSGGQQSAPSVPIGWKGIHRVLQSTPSQSGLSPQEQSPGHVPSGGRFGHSLQQHDSSSPLTKHPLLYGLQVSMSSRKPAQQRSRLPCGPRMPRQGSGQSPVPGTEGRWRAKMLRAELGVESSARARLLKSSGRAARERENFILVDVIQVGSRSNGYHDRVIGVLLYIHRFALHPLRRISAPSWTNKALTKAQLNWRAPMSLMQLRSATTFFHTYSESI